MYGFVDSTFSITYEAALVHFRNGNGVNGSVSPLLVSDGLDQLVGMLDGVDVDVLSQEPIKALPTRKTNKSKTDRCEIVPYVPEALLALEYVGFTLKQLQEFFEFTNSTTISRIRKVYPNSFSLLGREGKSLIYNIRGVAYLFIKSRYAPNLGNKGPLFYTEDQLLKLVNNVLTCEGMDSKHLKKHSSGLVDAIAKIEDVMSGKNYKAPKVAKGFIDTARNYFKMD